MITSVTWQNASDDRAPVECVMRSHDGMAFRYIRTDLASERALQAAKDGRALGEELRRADAAEVVAAARGLRTATTFAHVHAVADQMLARFGPLSESPDVGDPQVTP